MIEWPLIFLGGLLGSSHCLGMCGPLALALGAQSAWRENLVRQLIYSVGRIFTYTVLGAVAGFGGAWMRNRQVYLVDAQAWLAVVAGISLLAIGLGATGIIPWRPTKTTGTGCLAGTWLATFFRGKGWTNAFLAGLFTGFIPCGLVYGFVAIAASTGQMSLGALTMTVFGIGTVPLMVLAGCGGSLLNLSTRSRVLKVAAWCIVITGCISIARGVAQFEYLTGAEDAEVSCPLCD